MYLQTCEATHVRGEQSAEVLDLRMSCLNDNLDQVRALTDVLLTPDGNMQSRVVAAAQDLTPISRCADVALLKSSVPLPKDEYTLREVHRLRRSLAEIQALHDLGNYSAVLKRSVALRPEVESLGYKPLVGELLTILGGAQLAADEDSSRSEPTLRHALTIAEASRDDLTAAKAVVHLIFLVGYRLGRVQEAEFWTELANGILDRLGGNQDRLRAWAINNYATALWRRGDYEEARGLYERALVLKERSVGREHPDFAGTLSNMSFALVAVGRRTEGLAAVNRAVDIFERCGDSETIGLANAYDNRGDALYSLERFPEAQRSYERSLEILSRNVGPAHPDLAWPVHGIGLCKLAQGQPGPSISFLEKALRIRERSHEDPVLTADSEFGLARALWEGGADRKKARLLATAALKTYREERRPQQREAVENWLAKHDRRNR